MRTAASFKATGFAQMLPPELVVAQVRMEHASAPFPTHRCG